MRIISNSVLNLQILKRNKYAISYILLLVAFFGVFLEISQIFSMLVLPLFILGIPGYLFAKIFFSHDDLVDKLLLSFGFSIFNSTVGFYVLLFLYNRPVNTLFSRLFLIFLFFESFTLLSVDYFISRRSVTQKFESEWGLDLVLAQKYQLLLGFLLVGLFFVQILFKQIPLYWPDEHTYVYTSRNLLDANYSFTPLPPVMDPQLWVPRYVFIGLNTLFYLFFGVNLTAPQAMVIISSLILILATFALARLLFDEKTGLIASLYLAFNPLFWWVARRVIPEMLVAALVWSGIYFMIKACKQERSGSEFKWQYVPISGLFFILAIYIKLTAVFLIPTFIMILLVFRQRIGKKRTSIFYMISLAGIISFLGIILASGRYTEYLFFLLRNFSYFLNRWDWHVAYVSMIEPILIISPVVVFGALGIIFDFKTENRGKNTIILFTAWATYFILPLILPDQALDPRHVFPAHIGPSIIAAYGTVEATKREKLWERMLYVSISVQIIYETWIREYIRISQISRFVTELTLLILALVILKKLVQKVKLQPTQTVHNARAAVLLGLIIFLCINGLTLTNLGWSSKTRRLSFEILTATQTSLELSGNWLIENTDESSILMTNEFVRLPYYADYRITYPLPVYEFSFFSEINQKEIEYLILFWSIWSERYPYMFQYIENTPLNMIEMTRWDYTAEDGRELGFVIYNVITNSV